MNIIADTKNMTVTENRVPILPLDLGSFVE